MNLTRLLNSAADCYTALRLAGWSAEEAGRIVTEAARDAVNAIPSKPYPKQPQQTEQHNASDNDLVQDESLEF